MGRAEVFAGIGRGRFYPSQGLGMTRPHACTKKPLRATGWTFTENLRETMGSARSRKIRSSVMEKISLTQ